MDISISEVTSFLRCRRMWDYSSSNRQGLKKIGAPKPIMNIGTLMHAALTAHARGESGTAALWNEVIVQRTNLINRYRDIVGTTPSDEELTSLTEQEGLVTKLYLRYVFRYGQDMGYGRYNILDTERTFRVPIPGIEDAYLIGTLDRIFQDKNSGALYPGEIKTYARLPSFTSLQLRPQFVAYAWALQQLFPGHAVNAVLYDGVRRELPNPPNQLKSGEFSKASLGTTDYQTYLEALGSPASGTVPSYQHILDDLKERDAQPVTPFYARYMIGIFQAQMDHFGERLPEIFRDMQRATIYPNFMHTCEYDCSYRDLCNAQELGESVDYIKEIGYTSNLGSQSFMQRHGTEHEVSQDTYQ